MSAPERYFKGKGSGFTFFGIFVVQKQVEVSAIGSDVALDDISLDFKNRNASAIKCDTRRIFLRTELVEHVGRHVLIRGYH